jgi:hypothetical protein
MDTREKLELAVQEPGLESVGGGSTVPCKVASVVWEDAQRRFQRYSTLVYILALLALTGIVAGVVLFLAVDDETSAALVSLVSGLLSGGLGAFIKGERDNAKEARDAAQGIVDRQCAGQTAEAVVAGLGS